MIWVTVVKKSTTGKGNTPGLQSDNDAIPAIPDPRMPDRLKGAFPFTQ